MTQCMLQGPSWLSVYQGRPGTENSQVLSWRLTYAGVGARDRATNTIKDIQSGDAAHIIERKATNTLKVRSLTRLMLCYVS